MSDQAISCNESPGVIIIILEHSDHQTHLVALHLVDNHTAQLLLGVVAPELVLVQRSAREQIVLIRRLACKRML